MHLHPRQNNTFTGLSGGGEAFFATSYRFSFNGKENDNEVKGEGNSLDFGARMYDSRLGRFLSPDPREEQYCWQSTYVYAANNPIYYSDLNGEGPGKKCKECGNASEKKVGDKFEYKATNGTFSITYQIFEENGIKFWDIVGSNLDMSKLLSLEGSERVSSLASFIDRTSYVKVQSAYENTLLNRIDVLLPGGRSLTYSINTIVPSLDNLILQLVDPLASEAYYEWPIDNEGFIHLIDAKLIYEANSLSTLKLLNKAKPIWQLVREGSLFTNGSTIQKMVANYWKKGASIGNGGTADMVLHELQSGKELKHLEKMLGYRKAFTNAVEGKGSYGVLNSIQKEFLLRELTNMENVLKLLNK